MLSFLTKLNPHIGSRNYREYFQFVRAEILHILADESAYVFIALAGLSRVQANQSQE